MLSRACLAQQNFPGILSMRINTLEINSTFLDSETFFTRNFQKYELQKSHS